jgi:hypothetical protein
MEENFGLEFKLNQITESKNSFGDWQHYSFVLCKDNVTISSIIVERWKQVVNGPLISDEFYVDLNFCPPKPRPFLFYMGTEESYRGQGFAGKLVEFANEYFKNEFKTPLYSGTTNVHCAPRVWEKLVEEGKAVEKRYGGKQRWAML